MAISDFLKLISHVTQCLWMDPNLGFLDAILYLEPNQVENDLVEVFVLEIEGWL